jgi:excisionase family DNA binding protein
MSRQMRQQMLGRTEASASLLVQPVRLPQLVTPEEAAGYLGISPYTVRERLKEGSLPGRKHGARWLIRVVDLVDYVEPNNLDSNNVTAAP